MLFCVVVLVRRKSGMLDLELDVLCRLMEWSVEPYSSEKVDDNLE